MKYDFLDIGCKDGRSFPIAYELGYKSGLGIDINENHVKSAISKGFDAIVADATNLPFPDKSFKMTISNHVLEHLPSEEMARKAINEMIRVTSEKISIGFPIFDYDEYLNSLGLRTFYSHWKGHTNMMKLSNLLDIFSKYKYDLKMIKRIYDSSAIEIHSLESPIDCLSYDKSIHPKKEFIKFDPKIEIYREFKLTIHL
jgi:SAM-dependent methyltransferase